MNWEDFKAKYGDRPKDIIFALAFLEGKEMGIREVVEWKDAECQERIKRIFEEAEEILFNLSGDGKLLLVNNPVYDRAVRKWLALKKRKGIKEEKDG